MSVNNSKLSGQICFQIQQPKYQLLPFKNHWDKLYSYV